MKDKIDSPKSEKKEELTSKIIKQVEDLKNITTKK